MSPEPVSFNLCSLLGWSAKVAADGRSGTIEHIEFDGEPSTSPDEALNHCTVTLRFIEGYRVDVPGASIRKLKPPIAGKVA